MCDHIEGGRRPRGRFPMLREDRLIILLQWSEACLGNAQSGNLILETIKVLRHAEPQVSAVRYYRLFKAAGL